MDEKDSSPEKNQAGAAGASLLRLIPPVLRARDFHLYTRRRREEGGRLVDLWQNGGAAILGHKPPAILRELKNAAARGLFSPLPHPLEKRLIKALSRLFPRRIIRFYAPGTSLSGILEAAGLPPSDVTAPPDDPAFSPAAGTPGLALWRPFLDEKSPLAAPEGVPVLIPLLPGLGRGQGGFPSGPLILALDPVFAEKNPLPPSDLIPPACLAVITRGIYDLIAAGPERGRLPFPKIRAALSKSPWRRRGIYLTLGGPPDPGLWGPLFRAFLAGGFLLPPEPGEPLILPGALSPGEEAKLAGLLADKAPA